MRLRRTALSCIVLLALVAGSAASASTSAKTAHRLSWHHKCPKGFGFCADFPYVDGVHRLPLHNKSDSSTSQTGKSDDFVANTMRNSVTGRYCETFGEPQCVRHEVDEIYFVTVIRSKYADKWQAMTALNGKVQNPVRTTFRGLPAIRFKGLYSLVGWAVYHKGRVYYFEAYGLGSYKEAVLAHKFFAGIRFH